MTASATPTSPEAREPEMLTQGQVINLSIATSLIEAYGKQAVQTPIDIADAISIIGKAVRG